MRRSETFCASESGTHPPRPLLPVWLEVAQFGGQERVYGPGRLSGTGRPMNRIRPVNRLLILVVSTLLVVVGASAAGLAAPITGANQAEPAAESERPPPSGPGAPAVIGDPDATVIEFSVLPSADDPTQMETVVILQRGGGRRVCVNLKSTDVIVRSYRKSGDEPFTPSIPGDIRGLTSGDTGELVGFNETNVFIRPHTLDDGFTNSDECFVATDAEGCFLPVDDDCDQTLEEGDVACVMGTISRTGCSLADHVGLTRQMRILVALNQPPGEAPIITAADIAGAPELAPPDQPGATLPGGPAPGGPTDGTTPGGSGGGDLVDVPNVIGMTLDQATATITGAGLVVGNVTIQGQQTGSLMDTIVRPAHAQEEPKCCVQDPVACQVCVEPGTSVDMVFCPEAAIPEPSTLALFATGLGLLILIAWRRRRRG